jgi:predicted Zn-dependent peptidase
LYQKTTLDNGLRILTSTMPYTSSVAISLFIGAGSRYESDAQAGISHFVEHLCFRGTLKRPTARDISTTVEGVGGILNGGTDKELTVYWCKVAKPYFSIALDVLLDMYLNSRFDPADIEKERQIIIEEINMSNDNPAYRVALLIDELLWPGHPLGRDIAGNKESITGITRNMLLDHLARQYQPQNTVIAVAGNIQHEETVAAVARTLGSQASRFPRPIYHSFREGPFPRLRRESRELEQVHLCLALPGLSLLHPQRFTLDLLNVILGDGMSSRLFTNIRDRLGLAYSISSYVDHLLDSGALIIAAGVDVKNLTTAIKAIVEELAQIKEPVPEVELTKAKEFSKGRLLLRMEDSRNVAGWMGAQEILTDQILSVDEALSIIDRVTVEEVQGMARELLVGEKLRLAVVGPVAPDEPLEALLKL